MGDILHVKSANTSVDTYESYQMVKYHLKTVGKSAIEYFAREDVKHSPVDDQLCRNLRLSSSSYRKELKLKSVQQAQMRNKILQKKGLTDALTRRAAKKEIEEGTM